MSELQPIAGWRKILIWIGAVLMWVVVITTSAEGETFGWRWWFAVAAAVIVTISAIGLSRHPTRR